MILSDGTIRELLADGTLELFPLDESRIQPASVDFTLGSDFLVFADRSGRPVDPTDLPADITTPVSRLDGEAFVLPPGAFVLGTTAETVGLPHDIVARAEGKSSLARLGLLIHITAGFIDPGFCGQVTLELSNVAPHPLKLWPGMAIGQLSFERLDRPAQRPYGHPGLNSKYQGQVGATGSRYARRPASAIA